MKLSIIVPVYQVEQYIRRGIDSLLRQEDENIEILLIDDGSVDSSGTICDEYKDRYSNIRVCHQPNRGVSNARNQGIRMASGKYITFFDPDDYVERNFYVQLLHEMEKNEADIVFSGYQVEEENGECQIKQEKELADIAENAVPQKLFLLKDCRNGSQQVGFWGSVCRVMFKKSVVLENHIFFKEKIKYKEDLLFVLDYLNHSDVCGYLQGYGYHYCKRKVSATSLGYKNYLIENERSFLNELDKILSINKRITQDDRNHLMARNCYYSARILISNEMRTKNDSDFFDVKQNRREFNECFLNAEAIRQMLWDRVSVDTIAVVFLAKLRLYNIIRWLYKLKFKKSM